MSDDAIFDAVAAVVTDAGPTGLTLAVVATRVGVSAPALTQRFGSKRGLLLAFSRRESETVTQVFERSRAQEANPIAAAVAALVALQGHIGSRDHLANNLAMVQMHLTDPELRANAVTHSRAVLGQLADLIQEAADEGMLSQEVRPDLLAADIYTTYSGAMLTWAIDGEGALGDWLRESVARTLNPYLTQDRDDGRTVH